MANLNTFIQVGANTGNFIGSINGTTISGTGNITGGNINTAGNVSATGDIISANTIIGSDLQSTNSVGDEGGQIDLATAAANTTLAGGSVTVDIFQNKFRIFESGGTFRGVNLDLSQTPDGNAGELQFKASGIVNAGTFVTLNLLKATVTTTGNRGLSLAATTGSFDINISGTYGGTGGGSGSASTATITTTPSAAQLGWNFTAQAEGSTYIITDTTNNRAYRVTLQIGGSFNNNLITIERLL